MVLVLIFNSNLKVNICLSVLNKYNTESRFSDALFGLFDALIFFSRFTPDVNLRSPGNRNSQADLQRLQTDGKIRADFLLLPDFSHWRFRVQKTEQQRLSLQERRATKQYENNLLLSDTAVIISWVSVSTHSQWLMVWKLKWPLLACLMSIRPS